MNTAGTDICAQLFWMDVGFQLLWISTKEHNCWVMWEPNCLSKWLYPFALPLATNEELLLFQTLVHTWCCRCWRFCHFARCPVAPRCCDLHILSIYDAEPVWETLRELSMRSCSPPSYHVSSSPAIRVFIHSLIHPAFSKYVVPNMYCQWCANCWGCLQQWLCFAVKRRRSRTGLPSPKSWNGCNLTTVKLGPCQSWVGIELGIQWW